MKKLSITADSGILYTILKEEPELFIKVSYAGLSSDTRACFDILLKINGNEYLFNKVEFVSADEARVASIVKFEDAICSCIALNIFKSILESLESDEEKEEICLNLLIISVIEKIIK